MRSRELLLFATAALASGCTCASKVCDKGSLTESGSGNTEFAAKQAAKASWENEAYKIAPAYSSWDKARNQSLSCSKSTTINEWMCEATAEPCRDE